MRKESIIKFETALDHLTGEEAGSALAILNDMPEVLDAIYLTGIGKKNRPCCLLQVLCHKENESAVGNAIFRHTHTLGLRRMEIERFVLPRHESSADVWGECLSAKEYEMEGGVYSRPEADAVRDAALRHGLGAPALRFAKKG